jgi:hypothetical protein
MPPDSPDPAPAADAGWPKASDDWSEELHKFVLERFTLVQAAARFWLGTMTTLVGLFSALLVINRGESLAALSGPMGLRVGLYVTVVAIYVCAFAAVVLAAQASFGGLTLPTADTPSFWRHPLKAAWRQWMPEDMEDSDTGDWKKFRELRRQRANRARKYLHRSRALGIVALVVAAILALVVLALGGFADDPPALTYVVVVHDGQVTCGALERAADGRTLIGGQEYDEISQLAPVPEC